MDACTLSLLVVATVAVFLSGSAHSACSDADKAKCVNQALFSQLSTSNPTNYCEEGARIAGEAVICLEKCLASGSNSFLNDQISKISSFCNTAAANCTDVVGTYVNQTKCYDEYGGVELLLDRIFRLYQAKESISVDCQNLYWGRSCQRQRPCKYNVDLYLKLITDKIVLGLATCGSEDAVKLAPLLVKTECSQAMYSKIESECNIGLDMAVATTKEQACPLLEKQATCIETLGAGCTEATKRYLVPRMDSYAMANQYLGCNVVTNGIKVQSRSECDYSRLLNACFYADAVTNAMEYRLLPLLNRDLPIGGFCKNVKSGEDEVRKCKLELLSCIIPQTRLVVPAEKYDDSYAPLMGVFPLNMWGMNSIFTWLNGACSPDLTWSNRLYVAPVVDPLTTKKGTPRPKTTPKPEVRFGTPSTRGENELGNLQGNFPTTNNNF